MKFDKRNIDVITDHKWPISIHRSGYEIIRQGADLDAERFIRPKISGELDTLEISLNDIYIEIRKFLFKYEYNETPLKGDNNLPVLKEKFEGVEDYISADESGFIEIIDKFGLISQTKEESTEIWLSIMKYIALKGKYAVLDDKKIPAFNEMTKSEIQLFRSEREQFSKLNNEIKTEIRNDGLHLSPTTLGSALILFTLKHNFPQALKCQNKKGNCKKYFIDYSKAQKGEYCSPKCARAQNRFAKETRRQQTESGYIEDILLPKIEKSGWSNSDIKRDYIIGKRLKARADIVLTFEDKPLVMIEVYSSKLREDSERLGRAIRHAQSLKVRYLYICNMESISLTDLSKSVESEIPQTRHKIRTFKTWQTESIMSPEQAKGLTDA